MEQPLSELTSDEQILSLIFRHCNGDATREEEALLNQWRKDSADNERMFQDSLTLYREAEPPQPDNGFDVDAGWSDLSNRLGFDGGAQVVPLKPRRSASWGYALLAAAAALALFFFLPSQNDALARVEVAQGETATHTLPDGSVVQLNGGSVLAWAPDFNGNLREVTLRGHAFFEVKPDPAKPFLVRTESAKIRVLGTSFDVWARGSNTRVVVRTGLVNVATHQHEEGRLLRPNQMTSLSPDGSGPIETVDAAQLIGWREGKLVFHTWPVEAVAQDLSNRFAVPVVLDAGVDGRRTITAAYGNESVETILDELCLSLGLAWEKNQEGYVVSTTKE